MSSNPVIRLAQRADHDAVFTLAQGLATSFAVEPDAFALSFQQVLTDPKARLAVSVVGEVVVGYVLAFMHPAFYANGSVVWVEEIMVHKSLRGRGLGRLLMDEIESWARLYHARLVAVATRRAAPFYQALGYAESATYFRKLL